VNLFYCLLNIFWTMEARLTINRYLSSFYYGMKIYIKLSILSLISVLFTIVGRFNRERFIGNTKVTVRGLRLKLCCGLRLSGQKSRSWSALK